MIQDIFPHEFRNQYDPAAQPAPHDTVLCFDGSKILLCADGSFPKVSQVSGCLTYLFALDDIRFFLLRDAVSVPDGAEYAEVGLLRREKRLEKCMAFAMMTGKHLSDWYRDSAFCGRCGTKTHHSQTERACVCPACGNTAYPRIMPAVIVGVCNGDRIILTRYRRGYGGNALIAGFTEIGETFEQTVTREVMEEAGVRVKNIRYFASQPWGIANDILAGYFCDLDGSDEIHMDEGELKYAQWVSREEIILQEDDFSLTNAMMTAFRQGRERG